MWFSEYDQEQKYYPYKNEVTHKEILLPPHAPPEFADRNAEKLEMHIVGPGIWRENMKITVNEKYTL